MCITNLKLHRQLPTKCTWDKFLFPSGLRALKSSGCIFCNLTHLY